MRTAKCQSKQHSGKQGCTSPRCPEGLYVKKVISDAVKNQDVSAYLKARGMQDAPKRVYSIENGVASIRVEGNNELMISAPIDRVELREQLSSIDKTDIPSFASLKALENHISDLYSPYLTLHLSGYQESPYGWKKLSVGDMTVDADLRSTGMGRHVRKMLSKFCDENNIALFGTPTEAGDRSYKREYANHVSEEEHVQRAQAHKKRLIKYYENSGYEKNWLARSVGRPDYYTKEIEPVNHEWRDKFNREARQFLNKNGEYVRWPNGTVPKTMLQKTVKPTQQAVYSFPGD
jgi:hypothetical protein